MHGSLSNYLQRTLGGVSVVYGAGVGLGFAAQVLLTRLLGVAEYGNYYFVFAWLMALLVLAKFGLDSTLLRFVPAYMAQQKWGLMRGIMRWSAQRAGLAALGTSIILGFIVIWQDDMHPSLAQTFYIGCLMIPVLAYMYLRAALLRSLKHVVLALLPEAVIAPVVLGMTILLIASIFNSTLTSVHAMTATLVGFVFSTGVGHRLLKMRLPGLLLEHPHSLDSHIWFHSARSMLLITGAHALLNNTDAIMLGLLEDARSVGIYAVAAKCAILVSFPLTITNSTIAPLISQFHATKDHSQLQHALDHSMRLVNLASVAAFAGIVLFGEWFLAVFGDDFRSGIAALRILAFGALVNALAGPVANLLSLTGSEDYVSRVMVATTLLNIVLNLVLIPIWGIEGAASATAASMVIWNFLMYGAARKRLGVTPNRLLSRL